MGDTDEAAWIFSTYYYRLAFIQRDFSSPAWTHPDAYDHPPLAKFYYGAVLASIDAEAHSLQAKEWWLARTDQVFDRARFLQELEALIPRAVLRRARTAAAAAVALACLGVALVAGRLVRPGPAAATAVLLALMPLARVVAGQVLSDGPLLALLMLALYGQTRLAEGSALPRRRRLALAAACGALAGLAFDTKISAGLEAILLPLSLAAADGAEALPLAGLALACAGATAFAANPSLWRGPFRFAAGMFEHRVEVLRFQRVLFVDELHPNLLYRVAEMLKALFGGVDLVTRVTGAGTALLAAAGLWRAPALWRDRLPRGRAARVVLVHAAGWTLAAAASYALRWDVYLLPAAPYVCLLGALGLEGLLARGRETLARRAALTAAVAAVLCAPFSTLEYWRAHPLSREQRLEAAVARVCERFPERCAALRAKAGLPR